MVAQERKTRAIIVLQAVTLSVALLEILRLLLSGR
jgi:hypothetical protein